MPLGIGDKVTFREEGQTRKGEVTGGPYGPSRHYRVLYKLGLATVEKLVARQRLTPLQEER